MFGDEWWFYSNIIEATTPAQSGAEEASLEMPVATISQAVKENRMIVSPNPPRAL